MSTIYPTVYFIDDSATMREVIKIAFRRENISVVACHDAAAALVEIETAKPDIVITDVIMPDKDGTTSASISSRTRRWPRRR